MAGCKDRKTTCHHDRMVYWLSVLLPFLILLSIHLLFSVHKLLLLLLPCVGIRNAGILDNLINGVGNCEILFHVHCLCVIYIFMPTITYFLFWSEGSLKRAHKRFGEENSRFPTLFVTKFFNIRIRSRFQTLLETDIICLGTGKLNSILINNLR